MRSAGLPRLPVLFVAAATLGALILTPLSLRAQGDVWLLSTRCLSGCGEEAAPDVWRWSGNAWQDNVDEEAFLKADPRVPTTVVVHGNRSDAQDAVDAGWQVAEELQAAADGKRHRLLIWSWPADRMFRSNRRDVQAKAARSDVEAFFLGRLLNRMKADTPINLVGYSFGVRVITGALHLAAGGSVGGRSIAEKPLSGRRPFRAVLIASAENADWLADGHCHGLATTQLEQALVTVNGCDRVLKLYRHMYRMGGPPALGWIGPTCLADDDPAAAKLQLLNVSYSVGRTHDWERYFCAPELRALLPWYAGLRVAR